MEKLLNIDFNTLPGFSSYMSDSINMNPILFIAIATEGSKEEVDYLHGIWEKCKNHLKNTQFVLLNDHYLKRGDAINHSHPNARYKALQEWRESYKEQCNINNQDEEWLICDRDNQSFKETQYEALLNESKKNPNFHLIVSNPAFQIWLLLHLKEDLSSLNLDKFSKSKDRIKVIEEELSRLMAPRSYHHGILDWGFFAPKVKTALDNSSKYELSLEELKTIRGQTLPLF